MSRTAKKAIEQDAQPQLMFDAKRDINPFWRSSLFSDVYLKNDVPREYKHLWEDDEIGGFHDFYQGFIDLCIDTKHECFEKWREADTVKNWIVPVMDLLGWENKSERRQNSYMDNESFTILENGKKQTYRPDLLYFDKPKHKSYTQKEKDIDRKISEAKDKRTGSKIVVEAKYWDRLSNISTSNTKKDSTNDSASSLGPELQTLKYMDMFEHEFGILTDGKNWRLFHSELSQGMERRSYDFDLGNLRELALDINSYQNEEKFRHFAKYFYFFFSKEALIQSEESKTVPFVLEVFEYSKKYAHSIEEDLKKRFIITMGQICNSIKKSCMENNEDLDLELIRNVAESQIFNILFVKSCEVRRVLPIHSTQYLRYSLHEVTETLDAMNFDPDKEWDDYLRDFRFTFGKKFDWSGYEIFNRVINLFEIIHDGTAKSKDFGFEIEGFKESIFAKHEWKFAKTHKINNKSMVEILFHLNFIESSFSGRKYQQIPYSYFSPRQLGSIYESFLEYRIERAEDDLVFTKGQWKKGNLKSKKVKSLKLVDNHFVKKGDLFFSPDNKDRKMTGSYYTPDYVVQLILKETIGERLKNLSSEEMLALNVIDPAMGSGHFLSGALDVLTRYYRQKLSDELMDDVNESIAESSRKVLSHCLYGVDINPRAVKLAKMSLWLSSAYPGKKLECLNDQLVTGDSLMSNVFEKEFPSIMNDGGFDAVIGNPPYSLNLEDEYKEELRKKYKLIHFKMNLFTCFMELSLNLLKADGVHSFIVPSLLFVNDSLKKVREEFIEKYNLNLMINMGDGVFDGVSMPTAIYVVRGAGIKSKVESFNYADSYESYCKKNFITIDYDSVRNAKGYIIDTTSKEAREVFNKVWKKSVKLVDVLDINQGVVTGSDKKYVVDSQKNKNHKLTLKGKQVTKFNINYDDIFVNYIPEELACPRKESIFNVEEKIVMRRTGDAPVASIDYNKTYNLHTLYSCRPKVENLDLRFILGILNSNFLKYLYQESMNSEVGRTFAEIKIVFLRELPFPDLNLSNKVDKKFHNEIVKVVDSLLGSKKDIEKGLEQIDNLIFEFYNLEVVKESTNIAA